MTAPPRPHPLSFTAVLFVLLVSGLSAWMIARLQTDGLAGLLPIIWPAGGITLGLVFLSDAATKNATGARVYMATVLVGVLLGAWLASPNLVGAALVLGVIRCLEIWASWRLLRGLVARHANNLGHPEVLLRFTVIAMWACPFVSAVLVTAYMSTAVPALDVTHFFMGWWVSSGLGMGVFAPLVVSFAPVRWGGPPIRPDWSTLNVPWAVHIIVCTVVFVQQTYPFSFMCFVPLMWMVFRGGFRGAALGGVTLVAICLPLTVSGYGPVAHFTGATMEQSVLVLQVYISTGMLLVFPVGMILDHRQRLIARLKRREEELLHASRHDPLTDLLNRRGFDVHMQEELTRARNSQGSVSAVVLDVDHFKAYNDTYGHAQGDECLVWIAHTLRDKANAAGGLASRQGGEEFGVLLPQMTVAQAKAWAEDLRLHIDQANRMHTGSALGHVTVSMGVATRSATGRATDTKTLLQDADQALYAAKNGGRNRVCVSDSQRT